ncbi:MAG TPA: phosphoribosylanthranilate isomerase [Methyloceanibacter sp.]|nr:phosphoribosylanthranilate isomerase [Methyloceanibacter sp.]
MSVKVKICGVRTPAILDAAVAAGADYAGLVVFPRSPRHVTVEEAQSLAAAARGRIATVAVLVDPDDALIDRVVDIVDPDFIQLHGGESPARVAEIKARASRGIIKAVAVSDSDDVARGADYDGIADMILFDAKPSSGHVLPGGNGVAFDWVRLRGVAPSGPFALSGGLNADNVAAAIAITGAGLVDVSSGVETAPGEKDAALVAAFIAAAKAGAPQNQKKAS